MQMIENMVETLKKNSTSIVYPEGSEPRILTAAARLNAHKILKPILLGNKEEIEKVAKEHGLDIAGIQIIDPKTYDKKEAMIKRMVELRRGKMSYEEVATLLKQTNYFGTMLVEMKEADGLVGGATYSTADTVRPALQLVKTKPGSRIVSSCFIMVKDDKKYVMGDCAININPSEDDLVEIAVETAKTARVFSIEPKVGMLTYSTKGSGSGEAVDKVRNATERLKIMNLDFKVDGEFQFDAAISPTVAKTKAPESEVAGQCNTFIFPDIEAGNIGYKIAQRLGGYEAIGPILQGLNAPINDLSRGCNAEEVYKLSIITAMQKHIR